MLANFILVVNIDIPVHKFNIIITSKSPNLYCTHLLVSNNMISANFILCKMFFTNKTVFGYIQILIWNLSNPL